MESALNTVGKNKNDVDVEYLRKSDTTTLDKKYIYDEKDEMDCLRYANPASLVLALSVMVVTVFCILYYGIMNGLQNTTGRLYGQ